MNKNLDFSNFLKDLYGINSKISEANLTKLIQIVEYWFMSLDAFIELAGEQELLSLEELTKTSPNNSVPYAIDQYFFGVRNNKVARNLSNKHKISYFYLAKLILFFLRNNLHFIPNFKNYSLSSLFETMLLRSNALALDVKDKQNFIKFVADSGNYSVNAISFIERNLPDSFFKYLKPNLRFKKATVHCAPNIFLSSYKIVEFLFVFDDVYINGYQHGANYGTWKKNKYEEAEAGISDNYHLWFPHSKDIHYFKKPNPLKNEDIKVYWVGRKKINSNFLKLMIPSVHLHLEEHKHLPLIDEEFSSLENFYFCPFPKKERAYLPIKSKIKENFCIEEAIDVNQDILVFDNLSETVLFFALKHSIPFIIILSNSNTDGLQDKYESFLKSLRDMRLVFYSDEIKEASSFINSLQDPSNRQEASKKLNSFTSSFMMQAK